MIKAILGGMWGPGDPGEMPGQWTELEMTKIQRTTWRPDGECRSDCFPNQMENRKQKKDLRRREVGVASEARSSKKRTGTPELVS